MSKLQSLDSVVRVEITDEPTIAGRSGVKDGKPWNIPTKQPAYLWQGDRYPTRLEFPVPESGPYKPGFYVLAGTPFKTGVVAGRIVVQFDDRAVLLVPVEVLAGLKAAA